MIIEPKSPPIWAYLWAQIVSGPPDSIRFVYENELVRVSDVARSTRQNWAKNALLSEPTDGRYRERQVIEIVVVAQLVRALRRLPDVRIAWESAGAGVLDACAAITTEDYLVAVMEPRLVRLTLARSARELGTALRPFEPTVALPLARPVAEAREAFWRFAVSTDKSTDRRRRHPPSVGKRGEENGR